MRLAIKLNLWPIFQEKLICRPIKIGRVLMKAEYEIHLESITIEQLRKPITFALGLNEIALILFVVDIQVDKMAQL